MLRFPAALRFCLLALTLVTRPVAAGELTANMEERPDLEHFFADRGTVGTFVLRDLDTNRLTVVGRARAETRFVPASTFKIANALIGLDTGRVRDAADVFPYDGTKRDFAMWERDLTLAEAMRVSAVPVFQEIARRIGLATMSASLTAFQYGNADPGTVVDRFWLDGPLAISAVEQTAFLARLVRGELPVSSRSRSIVRDILRQEETPDHALFAKTGTGLSAKPGVAWWVGWVERGGDAYAFAINHDLTTAADTDTRKAIAREMLHALGIL